MEEQQEEEQPPHPPLVVAVKDHQHQNSFNHHPFVEIVVLVDPPSAGIGLDRDPHQQYHWKLAQVGDRPPYRRS